MLRRSGISQQVRVHRDRSSVGANSHSQGAPREETSEYRAPPLQSPDSRSIDDQDYFNLALPAIETKK
jgi:hypothetical protein